MPKIAQQTPEALRPFTFHGLRLAPPDGRGQCAADCPACGSSKFAVNVDTGMCGCYSAGCTFFVEGGQDAGGATKFLRWLWRVSDAATTRYDEFARERDLLYPETLMHWGVCQSVISGAWLFPAYSPDGALTQLYKRIWVASSGRWEMRPTPECGGHAVHGIPLLSADADTIYLAEKPSDAMPLWEALRAAKVGANGLEFTGNAASSLGATASVLAVANCGAVGEPLRRYLPLFAGKRVVLCFDSDHPKNDQDGAGWAASKRAAGMLAGVASEVVHAFWGDGGYDPALKDGHDVRDDLRGAA